MDELGQLSSDGAADLLVSECRLHILARIDQQRSAGVDLCASGNEVLHLHRPPLVGIDESLELSVTSLELSRETVDLPLQWLRWWPLLEPGVPRDPFGVRHDLAKVGPDDLIEDLHLHRLHGAALLRIAIAVLLCVLDAPVVTKDLARGSARPRPCRNHRVPTDSAAKQAPQERLTAGLRTTEREPFVCCEPVLGSREEPCVHHGRSRDDDPFLLWSGPLRALARASIDARLRRLCRLHDHDAVQTELPDVRSVLEEVLHRRCSPADSSLGGAHADLHQAARDPQHGQSLLGDPSKDLAHELGLFRDHLDPASLAALARNPAISIWHLREHQHACSQLVQAATPCALHDLCAFVLGDHSLHCKQHLVLGALANRPVDEVEIATGRLQLLADHDLVGVAASEPIGAVNEHDIEQPVSGVVSESIEPRSCQQVPGVALVKVDMSVEDHDLHVFRQRPELSQLALDGLLPFLPVAGHSCVEGGSFHSYLSPTACRGAADGIKTHRYASRRRDSLSSVSSTILAQRGVEAAPAETETARACDAIVNRPPPVGSSSSNPSTPKWNRRRPHGMRRMASTPGASGATQRERSAS